MKTLGEILDFFRANDCTILFFEKGNTPMFDIICNVRKREILANANEVQVRNFYNQIIGN